ncbi:PIG-L family deacetylase [Cesiribacter sp. SM1]|uniref:PIG-L family deacetylase n=1 Tax=Cesiribacter sp. SM1 TaxID=2861196 RepID=UPI001CD55980|nr:PIG-L family deacetylase [Cesiribacter sp. SM1]
MKYLYIFPHPDDESFGPVAAMYQQLEQGHEVHLLTLTRGGATKQRHKLGVSVEQMGEIRYKEMLAVKETVGFTSMKVLDLPDSGLKEMDPREIEAVIQQHIEQLRPDIVVSYPVHGISGFHDHLVMHAVIKRLYLQMKDEGASYLKRLAFFTLKDEEGPAVHTMGIRLKQTMPSEVDCALSLREQDIEVLKKALNCYETYQETIEEIGVVEKIGNTVYFEIWGEKHNPPLNDLAAKLATDPNSAGKPGRGAEDLRQSTRQTQKQKAK